MSPRGGTGLSSASGAQHQHHRLSVPTGADFRPFLLRQAHDSDCSHLGRDKTAEALHRRFYWPRMDIRKIHTRPVYAKPQGPLQPLPTPTKPFADIAIDFMSGIGTSQGFDRIMVTTDRFTKMVVLAPTTTNLDAPALASLFMKYIYPRFGLPATIVSDRDTLFTLKFGANCNTAIKMKLSTPLLPTTMAYPSAASKPFGTYCARSGIATTRPGLQNLDAVVVRCWYHAAPTRIVLGRGDSEVVPWRHLHARPRAARACHLGGRWQGLSCLTFAGESGLAIAEVDIQPFL